MTGILRPGAAAPGAAAGPGEAAGPGTTAAQGATAALGSAAADLGSMAPWADLDAAIDAEAHAATDFLIRLVRAQSTVGNEEPAQRVIADQLRLLGFDVTRIPVPETTAAELASIVAGARALVRFIAGYFTAGGLGTR